MIIPVKTLSSGYDIVLERGALNHLADYLKLDRKVLIVTDSGVPEIYSKTAAKQCKEPFIVTIEEGEPSKSFENYKKLLSIMVKEGFTRSDAVMAVGGGVVGDLSGFVAASFMRGVDFYNIPTTVLSQVDSSVGGKVAIDFEGYKNIVGAFYPPKAVIIDSETLKTLPQRQISNGLSEAVKMSLTSDSELFSLFENEDIKTNIDRIIEASLKIKRYVVEEDEKESGLRLAKNLLSYIDADANMLWQVPNQPGREGNYPETSGSAMVAYFYLKGARLGMLDASYAEVGARIFHAICKRYLSETDGKLNLGGICLVAGLGPENNRRRDGSYEYYISEPIVENDAKGLAPFLMCYTELLLGGMQLDI